MLYFDNAATTGYKPLSVITSMQNALRYLSANPGRGGHSMSVKCARLIHKARTETAAFLGLKRGQIAFSLNCTQGLNYAILGTVQHKGHVVTTALEHNSVIRPLKELERAGKISLTVVKPDIFGVISAKAVQSAFTDKTYLAAVNYVSNVTGAAAPIKQIGSFCKARGVLFLVDAAQCAGYGRITMSEDNIDLLAFAPHKGLHGPQGLGVLAVREGIQIQPTILGGTGTESESPYQPQGLPECLESGTLPTPAIAGLLAAINWTKEHMSDGAVKLNALGDYARGELQKIGGVRLYNPKNAFGGIVSFNVKNLHSGDVADILSEQYDICVRGGLHCAPLAHAHLGTLEQGIVRASFGFDTLHPHVDFLIRAVKEIAE
ncbi:MAG: aminotransferase class V-fold PLP-dependent enzyme [Firmicutes bacterium]|nr:aminotransferase class V-fold PLP-dependent enzyme [Bacillota bacterium]